MRIAGSYVSRRAQVAELVDALVSGTSGASRGGSSPLLGTSRGRKMHRLRSNGAKSDDPQTQPMAPDTNEAADFMTPSQLTSRGFRAERES
jgi:hypothetical protein